MDQRLKDQQKYLLTELGAIRGWFRKRVEQAKAQIRKEIYFGSHARALTLIQAAQKEFGRG